MLHQSTGPAHFYGINLDRRAQTEVHSQIVLGNITGTATHFIHQGSLASFDCDLCAYPVAIGAGSDGLKSDPVVAGMRRIHQEARPCVHVADEYGKLPVIPEIAHSQAARRGYCIDPWSSCRRHVRERTVAVVMIEKAWLRVPAAQVKFVHLRIDMSVGQDEIWPAVIVKVKKHGAPAQILRVQTESRGVSHIRKNSFTVIAVQGRRVIGEVGLKNIQPPVTVVIRDSSSHTRLLAPIFVERHSSHDRNIGESAIAIVVIKNTWGAVASYVDIWPAIIVEVECGNAEGITAIGLVDVGLGGNIHEGSVTAILIQNILRARQTTWSAHHRHALPNAGTSLARGWSSGGIEIHIISHHQVEAPVTVVVNESTAGTPGFT